MIRILTYHQIDQQQWQQLIERSATATWFQTDEAYRFYQSVSDMQPFVYGVIECREESVECKGKETSEAVTSASTPYTIHQTPKLKGVIVGYITQEKNPFKQFFTRRAIILGGPLLAEDISDAALAELLKAVSQCRAYSVECKGKETSEAVTSASTQPKGRYTIHHTPIYIESRNFHDYLKWRSIFEANGFAYQPHLNFHVDTSSIDLVDQNISESRKRDIRTTIREGVTPVYEPTIEQVRAYYEILKHLYKTKVKTPLFSWEFFEELYHVEHAHYILTEYQGHIVGGTIVMELPRKAMYEWFECGLDGVGEHIYPSTYATYLGIKYAAEHGCPLFDMMGAGKPDVPYGVRDFKAKFGGELVEYGRFLCVRKPLLYWIGKNTVRLLKRNIKN